ncbi:MAG: DUF881 domain-containing protein [Armatimonadetes bacterium]|nr:DUF881 domain-containing protein [Armatimonadota bacterium]
MTEARGHAIWWQAATAVALAALGLLVVNQIRAGRVLTTTQPEVPTRNIYALATLLRGEREARKALEVQVAEARRQLEEYEKATAQGRTTATAMARDLEQMRTFAGLKAMRGPGVVVRLEDVRRPLRAGKAGGVTSPVVVQYHDLVAIINELWAAGAEAVAVNSQRIAATSGIGQVAGTVVVNLQRLPPPFEIAAIGDAATLEGALNIRGGLVEGLRGLGLSVTIARRDVVEVPAFKGRLRFEYAKPVE